jgi:ATP-binding cassette subfamily B protein
MKRTVDAVTAAAGAPDPQAGLGQVFLFIGLMGAAALAAVLLASAARVVGQAQGQAVTDHVQDVIHAQSVALDLEYYENSSFYDTLHRAQVEAPHRPAHIVNGLVQVVQSFVTLCGIAGLLLSCHWAIAAVLFVSLIPGLLLRMKYAGQMYRLQAERSTVDRKATYLNWLLTGQFYAKEIRVFDLGALFIDRFRTLRRELRSEKIRLAFRFAFGEWAAETGAALAIFGSLAFIAYRTVQGAITLGDMVMYYQAFQRGQATLRDLLGGLAGLYEDNLFLTHFNDFLELKPKVGEPAEPRPAPRPMKQGIVFENVSFRYPTGETMVLEEVNLTIQPGQVVALVGENGSGKTTLVKLLCRLYDPTAGTITVDGQDLRRFGTRDLRREFGVIFQDYAQYQMTALENIRMGDILLGPDDPKIMDAAKASGADEFLAQLPQGYHTPLGKWFGNGTELSVGQWQKVALARALLRDAQVVILDEPTSSMDAKSEYAVFNRFRDLTRDRATVLISHRFSTIRMADRIYMLKNGRIVEQGSHDELMDQNGQYARLFRMQARYYK